MESGAGEHRSADRGGGALPGVRGEHLPGVSARVPLPAPPAALRSQPVRPRL